MWHVFQFRSEGSPSPLIQSFLSEGLPAALKKEFDYIVIDCPPTAVSSDAELWLGAADAAVLVVREDWADVRVINDTVDMIWQSGKDFVGFVLNAFHGEGLQVAGAYGYAGYGQEKG